MDQTTKIESLISESEKFTFENNSYKVSYGTYTRPSIDLQVWIAECEDFFVTYYGEESAPWKLYSQFEKRKLNGYEQEDFNQQIAIIISALKVCLRISSKIKQPTLKSNSKLDTTKVFIVHGHDEEVKSKVARFIEKIGFEPIILHEQASSGNTIIEKIEEYSNVGFGIVLYTPCDIGGKQIKPQKLKSRARQNVVFEHGYLIGRIGRDKVCALVKGDVETPNDISGVVYVSFDNADAWQMKIAKELKRAGYIFDSNKII